MNKRELINSLKTPAAFENDILIDTSVGGFDHHRNLAKVSFRRGTWFVRKYNPEKRWFGDEVKFDTVGEVVKFIEGK